MHHVVITYAGHCKYERRLCLRSFNTCFEMYHSNLLFVYILDVPNSPAFLKDAFLSSQLDSAVHNLSVQEEPEPELEQELWQELELGPWQEQEPELELWQVSWILKKIIFLYQLVLQQVRNNLTIQSKLRLQIFCLKSLHSSYSFLLEYFSM